MLLCVCVGVWIFVCVRNSMCVLVCVKKSGKRRREKELYSERKGRDSDKAKNRKNMCSMIFDLSPIGTIVLNSNLQI